MDCKTPILGHSALRCAGLSRSQARLQAIPATIYLLGGLAIVAIWLKFAIEKRVFAFCQVLFLSLTGILGFAVVVASIGLRLDGAGSVGLGGMSSLVCISQLLASYYFLPSRYTLPRILDSSLAALSTSSILLDILASIHQGRLLPSSDSNNIVYAECTCLVCFYLLCIGTSQFPRYFILIREDSIERQQREPEEMITKIVPSITFILAMAFFLTQACLGFTLYPAFAVVMSASMASAIGYCFLVATFLIHNWSKRIPYSHNFQHGFDGIETSEKAREGEVDEEHMRPRGQDVTMQDTHHLAAPPILKVPSHHRVRSPSTIIRSETGSVVWAGNVTPNPEAGGNPKTAKLNGIQNSIQSRASWDRIQYLMKRDRRTRCPSGITDYGTETSYFEGGGRAQQRTSMLSTIAMAVGGYGNSSVPPVPPISVHYLTNQNQSDATLSHYTEPAPMRDITNDKMDKMTARNFAASTHSPETTTPSNGVLPLQYQSSKLFPAVEWETGDTIIRGSDTASPVASDMKHSRSSSYSVGQSSSSLTSLGGDRQAESDNKHGIGHRPPLAPFSHMQIRRASVQAESIRTPFRK